MPDAPTQASRTPKPEWPAWLVLVGGGLLYLEVTHRRDRASMALSTHDL